MLACTTTWVGVGVGVAPTFQSGVLPMVLCSHSDTTAGHSRIARRSAEYSGSGCHANDVKLSS